MGSGWAWTHAEKFWVGTTYGSENCYSYPEITQLLGARYPCMIGCGTLTAVDTEDDITNRMNAKPVKYLTYTVTTLDQ